MDKVAQSHEQPFLRRVKIRNFKSIGGCDVELGSLTLLVGKNGAGKSNFLDALRFVADSLQSSLDQAIRERGGIQWVRRCAEGTPREVSVELELLLPEECILRFGIEIMTEGDGGFAIKQERLTVWDRDGGQVAAYRRKTGDVVSSTISNAPPARLGRLYLANVAGFPEFSEAFAALTSMGFYKFDPGRMKELQNPDAAGLLNRDGSNIASVVGRLHDSGKYSDRFSVYLEQIVPGVTGVERVVLGPRETLQFNQRREGDSRPVTLFASSMSDGTLRALGSLVAVTQLIDREAPVSLVGIEEPETALHPAAAGILMDALREAATHTQILVTTHSPDLCDQIVPDQERLLVVEARDGVTRIAPADRASLEAIRSHLYQPGELLRLDQLEQDAEDLERQRQLGLFDEPVAAA